MSDLEQLTKTIIQTQLLEALKGNEEYIDSLVRAVFEREVSEHGGKPDYHSKEKMPWLEYCARESIEIATRHAVREVIKELEPKIQEAVRKSLSENDVVAGVTKKLLQAMGDQYMLSVHVSYGDRP